MTVMEDRLLLSGNEAVALAASRCHVALGTGYPGTPSTEILESFSRYGGRAQWAPNEKVALEVATGVAFSGARALCTMKHVGVNVAADVLFTLAYTGVDGALVLVSADDPGMASSQNEQDTRHYARAAGVPMLEPSDSQEAYDFTARAIELSERFQTVVLLRLTTRICHSRTIVTSAGSMPPAPGVPRFERDFARRVMIPVFARPAHRRLREKLDRIAAWSERGEWNRRVEGTSALGVITSGVAYQHVREAAPDASVYKLGLSYPLPVRALAAFAAGVDRCVVIDEGENLLAGDLLAAGIAVEPKPPAFRFGELSVGGVRRIVAGEPSPEPAPAPGTRPQLCPGCPHRKVFEALRDRGCHVPGDIGCYSLGALEPFESMDTLVCMGASIGVGLGMRHVLPEAEARKVVSIIGDSTFLHSGITGLIEAVYNPPPTGHVVLVLDNRTTAMTGLQDHPGTGQRLDGSEARHVRIEEIATAVGFDEVTVVDPVRDEAAWQAALDAALAGGKLSLIVVRRQCILAASKRARAARELARGAREGGA